TPRRDSPVTILSVAHASVAPYGAGLRFLSAYRDGTFRRGFYRLSGDQASDARRFAASALARASDALAVDAAIHAPRPEDFCAAGDAAGFCVYQPTRIRVDFSYRDSAYVLASEITATPRARWNITRDNIEDASSVELNVVRESPPQIDLHFRNPGRYEIT